MLHLHMSQPRQQITLEQHAAGRLIGSYRWIEKQLFRLVGAWSSVVSEPAVKVFLDQQSFEYAWHAELWADRMPDHRGLTPAGLTAPANSGVAAIFRQLADDSSITPTAAMLASVYRVILPRMIVTYGSHLSQGNGGGGDPTQRALRLILADEVTAWKAGEAHLQALLLDAESINVSIQQQKTLELLLLESGGLTNLET